MGLEPINNEIYSLGMSVRENRIPIVAEFYNTNRGCEANGHIQIVADQLCEFVWGRVVFEQSNNLSQQ